MMAVNEAIAAIGAAPACRALGLSRATLYRGRRPAVGTRSRPAPPRALESVERQSVLDLLHTRFIDQAPAQVHATLLDEGTYLCSPRTMYRLLDAAHEIKERRDQVRRPHYAAPELLATRPNEVWSWDISKLLGPAKWTYFYLYVILDIFSRYVVGWMLATHESAALAERLIAESCAKHGIQPGQLTLHADRGASMRSKPVALLLADLGMTKTHSRPHVSNDNPFSEAHFKTLNYCPQFSGAIRIDRGWPGVRAGLLPLVQPRASSQCARFPDACCRPFRTGRHGARASPTRARHRVCGASRTVRQGTASTGGSADRGVDQPAREDNDRPGCPGSTIGMSDDLRVDPIHDADDHSAIMLSIAARLLRQHLLVQDSQDGKPS
jgi:putative transposase